MHTKEDLLKYKRVHGLKEEISIKELSLLKKGMPVQKIIGFIKMGSIKIDISKNVLIPRYETEEVILKSLNFLKPGMRVLDLCSGSGFIGLYIKSKIDVDVVCSDISLESFKQMHINKKINKLDIKIIKGDLFENIKGKFDLIISNPPYIPFSTTLDKSILEYEPKMALFAKNNGNAIYKRIVNEHYKFLKNNGYLVFEISDDNSKFIKSNNFKIEKDINGKKRIAWKHF
ncbi:MAG: peptide chain release factor N(5)-glutamine methyltransferase [Mollicutes bacterium PWAP]|nr:peptide chain release factor N(5)-glutamine methyltransferase [Mollicutes bacterium PWAP]